MADALGTPPAAATPTVGVVSDEDHRIALAGLIAPRTSSLAVRTGVLWGPGTTALVTGTSATGTMTYAIALHHAVTTRGTADGVYLGPNLEAATTVATTAAPGANSRIDIIWAKQNDTSSTISADTGSTAPLYGVASGAAAASPVAPSIPVGAIELARATVAAGATATNGSGVTISNTAVQTVARGADIPVRNQAERDALSPFWPLLTVKRLDTGAIEMRNAANGGWIAVYDPNPAWTSITLAGVWSSYAGAGPAVSSGPYDAVSYRLEGSRVHLRGWANTTASVAGALSAFCAALPAAVRPSKGRTIWPTYEAPGNVGQSTRFEVFTDGVIYTVRGVGANTFLNFDQCSYHL